MKRIYKTCKVNDMALIYLLDDETQIMGFTVLPWKMADQFVPEGEWKIESLIQVKRIGDDYPVGFSGGHTMRNSGTCQKMKFVSQSVHIDTEGYHQIETVIESRQLRGIHRVGFYPSDSSVTVSSCVENKGDETESIELLSSFSICSIFGITKEGRTEDFVLHRLKSKWSEEGRLQSESFLDLQMEPSWQKYGVQSIRFGQAGSMPVRRYFPWAVIEDRQQKCMLGILMEAPASWQIEVFSEDDRPAISGGQADREFGHWVKKLMPGEYIETTKAEITVSRNDLDDICYRLTEKQRRYLKYAPESEKGLPVIFNEFCASWGTPSVEKVRKQAEIIRGKGIKYFVIDAGWYADAVKGWESNMGDWNVNRQAFPNGLKEAADIIKENGMVPGLWFEVENCGKDADIYYDTGKLVMRDGIPLTTGKRRFLDMRKEEVQKYLEYKIIGCMRENGFGYLKADYNDTIGIGCDGAESLGEGLRQLIRKSQDFYKKVKEQMPDIVMENCSSGGHRLEPSMMRLFSMASFSDAHECVSEPIIAANVLRAIVPAQSQIWAVMRPEADEKRMRYLLATAFLGRMCLSGEVEKLSAQQWKMIEDAISFYRENAYIIGKARVWRRGPQVRSYARPEGYQIAGLESEREILLVIHTFRNRGNIAEYLPELHGYQIQKRFGDKKVEVILSEEGYLAVNDMEDFDGLVIKWRK